MNRQANKKTHQTHKAAKTTRVDRRNRRLRIEALEDRQLLAVLTVNTLQDLKRAGDGLVSLREAIIAAENDSTTDLGQTGSGVDSIEFSVQGAIELTLGEMAIKSPLTINGPGASLLTIDAQQNSRIFNVQIWRIDGSAVKIAGLTLTGGRTNEDGGAIWAKYADLKISNCVIVGNYSGGDGGGVYSSGNYHTVNGVLEVVDSTISGNVSKGRGGGIAVPYCNTKITGSQIANNASSRAGGGVYTNTWRFYPVELTDSVVRDNRAGGPGGGFFGSKLLLTNSTISGNTTYVTTGYWQYLPGMPGGGGIAAESLVMLNSTVSENRSTNASGGGILMMQSGSASIESSSVTNNFARGSGGGIAYGYVELSDSSISGNSTDGAGGAIFKGNVSIEASLISNNRAKLTGGGIHGSHLRLIDNSTISGNSADGNGGGINAPSSIERMRNVTIVGNQSSNGKGGGIWVYGVSDYFAVIIADNTDALGNPDVYCESETYMLQHSLIGDNSGTSLTEAQLPDANGNLIGSSAGGGAIDPRLGPLGDHAGPTAIHALLPDSPALDAIPYPLVVPVASSHEYQLNGSLTDAAGGPALVALGGTLNANGYQFGLNQGLDLSSPSINPGEYTIEIVFSWNNLSGTFQKIIDFKNLSSDAGLYTYGNGLRFFNQVSTPNLFVDGQSRHLVLTRDEATEVVRAYVEGVEVWNFVDTAGDARFSGPNQIMRFFQDDTVSGQLDAESGFVDRIRIFDEALDSTEVGDLLNPPPPSVVISPFDQRGEPFARIVDGDGNGTSWIDIGAYESQGVASYAPGDYSQNGIVDAADYTIWRDTLGQAGVVPFDGADGNGDGAITEADYTIWKDHFGDLLTVAPASAARSGEVASDLLAANAAAGSEVTARRLSTGVRDLALSQLAFQLLDTPRSSFTEQSQSDRSSTAPIESESNSELNALLLAVQISPSDHAPDENGANETRLDELHCDEAIATLVEHVAGSKVSFVRL